MKYRMYRDILLVGVGKTPTVGVCVNLLIAEALVNHD